MKRTATLKVHKPSTITIEERIRELDQLLEKHRPQLMPLLISHWKHDVMENGPFDVTEEKILLSGKRRSPKTLADFHWQLLVERLAEKFDGAPKILMLVTKPKLMIHRPSGCGVEIDGETRWIDVAGICALTGKFHVGTGSITVAERFIGKTFWQYVGKRNSFVAGG